MLHIQDFGKWMPFLAILHIIALSFTIFRLVHRTRIRRLWWDDYAVALALPIDFMYFIVMWFRWRWGNPHHSTNTRVVLFYVSSLSFFAIVWLSRISMALSLTRLLSPGDKLRKLTIGLAVLYGVIGSAFLLQVGIVCPRDKSWYHSPNVVCTGTSWVSTLTGDFIGDVTLSLTPLAIVYKSNLQRGPKRLVYSVFAASILTLICSVALHTFVLAPLSWGPGKGQLSFLLSHLEATVALIVSNLLVITSVFYRTFRNGMDLETAAETDASMLNKGSAAPVSKTYVGSLNHEKESDSDSTEK